MNSATKSRNLIKGVGIYAIGTFGTKILSFLIVPLYTYYIVTEDYGLYDILMSTINLLTPIVTLQISDATYRWIIREDIKDKDNYIRATMQVLVTNCIIATLVILLVNRFYEIPYVYYFCVVLILSRAFQTVHKLLRGLKNQWMFAMSGIVYTIVFLSMNVLQLVVLHMGIECLFQSAMIANIIALLSIVIFEPRIRINYFKKPDIKLIIRLYRYSIPLVPNYLNWWVINSSDRYIVLWAFGKSANGILAVAHKFPTMLLAVLQLFTNSWQDVSVADTEKDIGTYYTAVFRKYSVLALSCLWCLIPATKVIIMLVMNESYKSACDYVAFYYMGTVFQSFSSFYGVGYLRNKKTSKAFSTSVYGAIVNAIINLLFIKIIGLQAAAVSTFAGFFVMWFIREKQNRNELGIKVYWMEFMTYTLAGVVVCIVSIYLNVIMNCILFVVGFVLFFVINRRDVKVITKKIVKKIKK